MSYDVVSSKLTRADLDALEAANRPAVDAGLQVEYGGDLVHFVERPDTGSSDKIGLAVAAVLLVLAFGSAIAAGLPIGVAIFALVVGLSLVGALSALTTVPSTTRILGTMIGLGVGIDYSLFVVTRQRERLAADRGRRRPRGFATETIGPADRPLARHVYGRSDFRQQANRAGQDHRKSLRRRSRPGRARAGMSPFASLARR